jgi:Holliday junction resolvase
MSDEREINMAVSTGSHKRRKGLVGEREASKILQEHGFEVRGLEGGGDHIASRGEPGQTLVLHVEIKRQERTRIPEWIRQVVQETPAGMVPLLCFRQNGEQWYAVMPLQTMLGLLR